MIATRWAVALVVALSALSAHGAQRDGVHVVLGAENLPAGIEFIHEYGPIDTGVVKRNSLKKVDVNLKDGVLYGFGDSHVSGLFNRQYYLFVSSDCDVYYVYSGTYQGELEAFGPVNLPDLPGACSRRK